MYSLFTERLPIVVAITMSVLKYNLYPVTHDHEKYSMSKLAVANWMPFELVRELD